MNRCRSALVMVLFAAALLPARDPLRVGVSIYPLKSMVEAIAGRVGEVFHAVPAGANPHLFEPTPSVIRRLREADIVFGIAPGFDGWISRFRPAASSCVYLKGKDFADNPHIWLSLRNASLIARKMARSLSALRPDEEAYFRENYQRFDALLREADVEITALFTPLAGRRFILWHPSWNYFAADYRLQIAGVIESGHGDEPSVRDFQKLVRQAKAEGTRLVVIDLNVQSRTAEALAREIGGFLLRLDALGDPRSPERGDYLRLMAWNARQLAEALRTHPPR